MQPPPSLLIGPAGWPSATRLPARTPHPLHRICSRFDAIAIEAADAARLRPEITRIWMRAVDDNPGFRFVIALPAAFTHDRLLAPEPVNQFVEAVRLLHRAKRLGCVLMSFPWAFKFTEENRAFFVQLRRTFSEFPLAGEMRHASWMHDEALGVFIDHHVAFANLDQPEHVRSMPPTSFLTTGLGLVRLHGRGTGNGPFRYSEQQLAEWKPKIDRIRQYTDRMIVIGNTEITASDAGRVFGERTIPRPQMAQAELFEPRNGRAVA